MKGRVTRHFVGTSRFSSSLQLSTMVIGEAVGSPTIVKRYVWLMSGPTIVNRQWAATPVKRG